MCIASYKVNQIEWGRRPEGTRKAGKPKVGIFGKWLPKKVGNEGGQRPPFLFCPSLPPTLSKMDFLYPLWIEFGQFRLFLVKFHFLQFWKEENPLPNLGCGMEEFLCQICATAQFNFINKEK
jgi:hypothetical protein